MLPLLQGAIRLVLGRFLLLLMALGGGLHAVGETRKRGVGVDSSALIAPLNTRDYLHFFPVVAVGRQVGGGMSPALEAGDGGRGVGGCDEVVFCSPVCAGGVVGVGVGARVVGM
jgi:hypothetical protein